MKLLLNLIIWLLITFSAKSQNWTSTDITKNITISMPSVPVKTEKDGITSYISRSGDSTFNIISIVTDMKAKLGLTSKTLAKEMEKEETWQLAQEAFLASLGQNAKLLNSDFIEINGLKTMKLEIERPSADAKINKLTSLVFVYDVLSYNLIFVNRGGKAEESVLNQFIKSIKFNK